MRVLTGALAALALTGTMGRGLALPRAAQDQPLTSQRTGITVRKDVEYGRAAGESLKLDLYLPAQNSPGQLHPGIVFVHGGGWAGGDKNDYRAYARELADRGYVAISVNYRLSPKYRYPAAVEDVQLAVRWLRGHAAEYQLAPDRIASMGGSAGGHLASILGVHDSWGPVPAGAPSSRVNCVVDYFGRMDLTMDQGGHDYRPDFIGKSGPEALALYREASPITYVDSHTVPFLIVQGTHDPQVDPEQSKRMLAALDKAGVESSLLLLSGQGHGFQGRAAEQAWDAAKAFLDRHLVLPYVGRTHITVGKEF